MDLTNALWITLIGMGLVFFAILLLWGLMALLVRVTADREPVEETPPAEAAISTPEIDSQPASHLDRKRKAAAAAVAAALAVASAAGGSTHTAVSRDTQPSGTLSAWQAVNRARQISQQHAAATRKKVVR